MTVLITLTTAGVDSGPFDIYSNLDGYTVPFETNVNKAALQAGYLSALVPDYTTTIRLVSKGDCLNHVDIVLFTPPTVKCDQSVSSGGFGVIERVFDLTPEGGVLIIAAEAQTLPNKFEIIHNNFKVATSGMTVSNVGPFDNVYGTSPSNVVPINPAEESVDQFIGTTSTIAGGIIPTRDVDFATENPSLAYIVAAPQQQLIWWNYNSLDYLVNSQAVLRITGAFTSAWDIIRKCETTTTTTSSSTSSTTSTTTVPPSTTTTTTTVLFSFNLSEGVGDPLTACAEVSIFVSVKSSSNPIEPGSVILNFAGVSPFPGGGSWYLVVGFLYAIQINNSGLVIDKATC